MKMAIKKQKTTQKTAYETYKETNQKKGGKGRKDNQSQQKLR